MCSIDIFEYHIYYAVKFFKKENKVSSKKKDPYPEITKALRRGRVLAKKLLKMEGGVMPAEEVATLLDVSSDEVFRLRTKGLLLAVKVRVFPRNPNFFKNVYIC